MGCHKSKQAHKENPQNVIDRNTLSTSELMKSAWHSMHPYANDAQIADMHTMTFVLMIEGANANVNIMNIEDNAEDDNDWDDDEVFFSDVNFKEYFTFR